MLYISLFVTSIYLTITGIYSFAIYNNICNFSPQDNNGSVFTFLCYPGSLMYLCILVLLYVLTLHSICISVQNKPNQGSGYAYV